MRPIKFKQCNMNYAGHQDEYRTLPAHINDRIDGAVTTCWQLTWKERFVLFFGGKLWLMQLTFHNNFQPQLPSIKSSFIKEKN